MKTKLLFGAAIFFGLLICSCKESDVYSCDPEINKWANQNVEQIRTMSRSEFLLLASNYQNAALGAMTPQQRSQIWKEKLEEVLALDWSEKERSHIEALLKMAGDVERFSDDRSPEVEDQVSLSNYKWADYAENELNWDRLTIYAVAFTPARVIREDGNLVIQEGTESFPLPSALKTRGEDDPKPDCSCESNYDCTRYSKCKTTDKCRHTPKACGVMKTETCTGFCYTLE